MCIRTALNWNDYELIDASDGNRLERWGNKILVRPDPQIIWNTDKLNSYWNNVDARYYRSSKGGGSWKYFHGEISSQNIHWKDLNTQHAELLESIKWINNTSYELACSCDKFPKVYAKSLKTYKRYVKRHWNKY